MQTARSWWRGMSRSSDLRHDQFDAVATFWTEARIVTCRPARDFPYRSCVQRSNSVTGPLWRKWRRFRDVGT